MTGVPSLARSDTAAMADNSGAADTAETVDVSFHGVNYLLTVSTINGDTMCIEVEQKSDASRWRGDFTSRYIEDITSKTGNFKKFPVFVKMLLSALKQASDSVFVDLLTYQDLEVLKSRKQGAAAQGGGSRSLAPNNKRYLILTYAGEFDRVHYPLPLLFEDNPDPQHLRGIISSLRAELDALHSSSSSDPTHSGRRGASGAAAAAAAGGGGGADQPVEMRRLREENSALRQQMRLLEKATHRSDQDGEMRQTGEARELAKELKLVRKERDLLQSRAEGLEVELERDRGLHRRELRRKAKETQEVYDELSRCRDQIRQLKDQVRHLMDELESRRTLTSSDRLRNTYGGRDGQQQRPYSGGSRNNSRGASPSSRLPSNPYPRPPDPHSSRGRDTSSRERGASPSSYSRPNSAPAARSGSGRFDPTEYVRQQRELAARRGGGSAGSSRAPTPPRSQASSGRASPAPSRPASADRARGLSPASSRPGGSYDGGVGGGGGGSRGARQGSTDRMGRPLTTDLPQTRSRGSSPSGASAGWSKFPPATINTTQARGPSRPQSAERSTSPGRALQEVKRKLSEYVTKRSTDDLSTTSSLQAGAMPSATTHQPPQPPPQGGVQGGVQGGGLASQSSSKSQLFNDASAEIADIDGRLHALQNFLRMAKASAPSVSSTGVSAKSQPG